MPMRSRTIKRERGSNCFSVFMFSLVYNKSDLYEQLCQAKWSGIKEIHLCNHFLMKSSATSGLINAGIFPKASGMAWKWSTSVFLWVCSQQPNLKQRSWVPFKGKMVQASEHQPLLTIFNTAWNRISDKDLEHLPRAEWAELEEILLGFILKM